MYWYLILFLIVMFLLSQKEHMANGDPGWSRPTHDVYGPGNGGIEFSEDPMNDGEGDGEGDDKMKGSDLYDPMSPYNKRKNKNKNQTPSDMGPDSDARPPPDTGSNSSDTTTKQNAIYFYKPFAMLPFPKADGPPMPYLDDFKVFQK